MRLVKDGRDCIKALSWLTKSTHLHVFIYKGITNNNNNSNNSNNNNNNKIIIIIVIIVIIIIK